jgi:hypothetical protein
MSERRSYIALLAAVCVAYVFLFWLWAFFGYPTEFRICDQAGEKCGTHNAIATLFVYADQYGGLITAIATIFIALFTLSLWLSSEKMWNATQQTLRHAQDTAARQLRAYVRVEPGSVKNLDTVPQGFVKITNGGQTPAHNLRVAIRLVFLKSSEGPFPQMLRDKVKYAPISISLNPGQVLFPNASDDRGPLGSESIRMIANKQARMEVFGRVDYQDAFGVDRRSVFHYLYSGPNLTGDGAVYTDTGNYST